MRILHVSDMHFGGQDAEAIAAVTKFTALERPDLIVASGDFSAIGLPEELQAACDWLATLGPPVVATPGNHDVPYLEFLPRLHRPFRRYHRANAGRLHDAWATDDLVVHTINTARGWQLRPNWALGAISRRQRRAACSALSAAPKDALKIIVTHHPLLFPPDSPIVGQTRGGRRAAREMIAAGADLFLAGHLHVTQETRVRGPRFTAVALTAGTLSSRLRGEPASFLMIEHVARAKIAVTRYGVTDGAVARLHQDVIDLESMDA